MIKIIHQTWKTTTVPDDQYPNVWQDSWRTHNPDWEYRFWTDEDNERLVRDCFPRFFEIFSALPKGVLKADMARLLYMYKHGGIYADLDYICLKPMTSMLEVMLPVLRAGRPRVTALTACEGFNAWPRNAANAFMYSDPGNWLLLRAIEDGMSAVKANPAVQTSDLESVFGSKRLNWLGHMYQDRAALAAIPSILTCPRGRGHAAGDAEAWRFWNNLAEVREQYPESYAVTAWRGGWYGSRWCARGMKPIAGC